MDALIRKCLHCGLPIPEGCRSDRKYCPEKNGIVDYCKNKVNNVQTQAEYHDTKGIKNIHILNRDILKRLLGKQETREIAEQDLVREEFKLEFIINKAQMRISKNEAFLYLEYGLELIGNGCYKIFKHGKQF